MRQFMIIAEGVLYDYGGTQAHGFWYNPQTGQHINVTWEHDNDEHHADKVMNDPALFGLSTDPDYFFEVPSDAINSEAIEKGWVRVTVTDVGKKFGSNLAGVIDGQTRMGCAKTARWLFKSYPEIDEIQLECTETGYRELRGEEMERFVKKGLIATKTA